MSTWKQDWKRPAVLAVILLALIIYTLFRDVPERSNVDRLEAQLASYPVEGLSQDSLPVAAYTRYYAVARPRKAADLRINLAPGVAAPIGQAVIVGVLVKPGAGERDAKPGIRRVRLDELPIIGDGGCDIVDVIYHPARDAILDARCHGSLRPPPPTSPPSPPAEAPPLAGG